MTEIIEDEAQCSTCIVCKSTFNTRGVIEDFVCRNCKLNLQNEVEEYVETIQKSVYRKFLRVKSIDSQEIFEALCDNSNIGIATDISLEDVYREIQKIL